MTSKRNTKPAASTRSTQTSIAPVTFTLAASVCPNEQIASAIANRFGLPRSTMPPSARPPRK